MDERRWCCFHPREAVVGVCALCLNERLLVLASTQQSHVQKTHNSSYRLAPKRVLPKIFALSNLLGRSDIKHHKSEVYYSSSTSPEESFISIKFEDNGVASWDKGKISTMSHDPDNAKKIKTMIEVAKPRAATLRWRRRIGHLFQLSKWKRSSVCHVGTKLEGGKVRNGWIRSLTLKRRTKE